MNNKLDEACFDGSLLAESNFGLVESMVVVTMTVLRDLDPVPSSDRWLDEADEDASGRAVMLEISHDRQTLRTRWVPRGGRQRTVGTVRGRLERKMNALQYIARPSRWRAP